jgi:hypothetical protein
MAGPLLASAQTVGSARRATRHVPRVAVSSLLGVAGVAMLLTASFHTETVAGVIPTGHHPTTSGRLHDIGSGVTNLALFAAAVSACWLFERRHASRFRALAVAAPVACIVVDIGLLLVGASVGGLRERLLSSSVAGGRRPCCEPCDVQ